MRTLPHNFTYLSIFQVAINICGNKYVYCNTHYI